MSSASLPADVSVEDLEAHFVEQWPTDPLVVLEAFRDCCIVVMECVARAYWEGCKSEPPERPIAHVCIPFQNSLGKHLRIARAIWDHTDVNRFLTRTSVVRVDALHQRPCRYDGSCFHEVAINFGVSLKTGFEDMLPCTAFCAHISCHTGRGAGVTDYLKSFSADIRCEAQQAIERWKANAPSDRAEVSVEAPRGQLQRERKLNRSTEARNRWIYEQCHKGVPYTTISIQLKTKPKTWDRIESQQGIVQAAQRYAKRHKLPPPPRRLE